MRKAILLVLMSIFLWQTRSSAQCSAFAYLASEIYRVDTTIEIMAADTSAGTAGYTYQWHFSDGTDINGPVAAFPITSDDVFSYTLTVTDPASCVSTWGEYVYSAFILHCPSAYHFVYYDQGDFNNANSVSLQVETNPFYYYYYYPSDYMFHAQINWGNGTVTSGSVNSDHIFMGDPFVDASTTAPGTAPGYRYGGQYTVSGTGYITLGAITCPSAPIDTVKINVGGKIAHPLMSGAFTVCAGDTFNVFATDTTMFHNMYHNSSIPASGGALWPVYYYDATGQLFEFSWYDRNRNLLAFNDTALSLKNLTIADSGLYFLQIHENINYADTLIPFHITVNGSLLILDSIVNPVCGGAAGYISLYCQRANDSVQISYLKDGISQAYSGRTDADGHIRIPGLTDGSYSMIRAHFVGDVCGSNILKGPSILHSLPYPVIADTVVHVCNGSTLHLSTSSDVPGATYSWTGPDGFSSALQSPSISSVTSAAEGYYIATVHSGTCAATAARNVHVIAENVIPAFATLSMPDTLCPAGYYNGNAQGLTFSSSDTNIIKIWSNGYAYSFTAIGPGLARITYSNTNSCGTNSAMDSIYVKNAMVPPITGPDHVCLGDIATFTDDTSGGKWSVSNSAYATIDTLTGQLHATASAWLNVIYKKTLANHCVAIARKAIATGKPHTDMKGNHGVFPGSPTTLTPVVTGSSAAMWSCSPSSVATVNSSGVVSGIAVGGAVVSYISSNSCGIDTVLYEMAVSDWIDTRMAGVPNLGYPYAHSTENTPAIETPLGLFVRGVAMDTMRNLYILDAYATVHKVDRNGVITTYAGMQGVTGYSGDGGPAVNARLGGDNGLKDVKCDRFGNLFVLDEELGIVRKIDRNGIISTYAGVYSPFYVPGFSGDGGPATSAVLYAPRYIDVDNDGNLYIADYGNSRIRKVNTSGIITTIAGTGTPGNSGDGAPAVSANITPIGLAIDSAGNVIISSNGVLRKIGSDGIITTIAGGMAGGTTFSGGPASMMTSVFNGALACDKKGNIYVNCQDIVFGALNNSNYIRKIDRNGIATIVAGGGQGPTIENDPSVNVLNSNYFYYQNSGIYADDSGSVYFGDYMQSVARKEGKPSIYISSSADTICAGVAVTFTAKGYNTGRTPSYQWQKNGVDVGTDADTYTATSLVSGDTISCKVYNRAGGLYLGVSNKKIIIVGSATLTAGTITGNTAVCAGNNITLTDTTTGGTWGSNNTGIVTVSVGVVTGVSAGTAIISYTVSDACGTATDTMEITVLPQPNAGTITGDNAVCAAASVTLTNVVAGGTWSSSSASATVTDGTVTGVSAGYAIISYTVSNSCGTATDTMGITISDVPSAGTIIGSNLVCMTGSITLSDPVAGGTWSSSTGAVTISSGGVVTAVSSGSAIISYTVTNACGTATDTIEINVGSLPSAGSIAGVDTICAGFSQPFTESAGGGVWSSTDPGVIAITTTGVISAVSAGTATIHYTVTNSCGTATASQTVHVLSADECNSIGVASVGESAVSIYPNPASGMLNIDLPVNDGTIVITLTDVSGKVIKTMDHSNGNSLVLSVADLARGVYLINITGNTVHYKQKIVLW